MKLKYTLIICSLLLSADAFSQYFWTEQNSGVSVSLNSVSNVNASVAWVCGDAGTVLNTTNNGNLWFNLTGFGIPTYVNLNSIYGISGIAALIAGNSGTGTTLLYKTTNFGATWTAPFYQDGGSIIGVWSGFLVGNPVGGRWSLWKSTNSGNTWDSTGLYLPQIGSETGFRNSLYVFGTRIWFGTTSGKVYYSSNNGTNWSSQLISPETNSNFVLLDNTSGMFGFTGGTSLLTTSDGGSNWSQLSSIGSGAFNAAAMVQLTPQFAWYLRSSSNIYYSTNSGSNWSVHYTAPSGNYNHISSSRSPILTSGVMYAVRDNGGISRCNFFIQGVTLISGRIPENYMLKQNYPNPFNSSTIIKFEIPKLASSRAGEIKGGFIRLIVYDIAGRELASFANEVIQPGTYQVSWDAKDYASGVYFYALKVIDPQTSADEFVQTRKMVLLK